VEIDSDKSPVGINRNGTSTVLTLNQKAPSGSDNAAAGHSQIELQNIDLNQVLAIYAEVSGRTILRHPTLRPVSLDVKAFPTNQVEAAQALEKALEEKGIATILDGEKFVKVVPKAMAAEVSQHSSENVSAITNLSPSKALIPTGSINFIALDVNQMLPIYAQLVGRKLVQTDRLPPVQISLKSTTPLTVSEVIHALDTLLRWSGLKVVPVGDDSLKAVSIYSK
jgi:hypothetical protein